MFGFKRVVVAKQERGLYIKDRSIEQILMPGVYRFFDIFNRIEVELFDIETPEFEHRFQEYLMRERTDLRDAYFQFIELGEQEVGLVYKNGKLSDILAPGSRQLYFKGVVGVRVEVVDISKDFAVARDKVALMLRARAAELQSAVKQAVLGVEIANQQTGLLFVDGMLSETLATGLYAFYKFNRSIRVEVVDSRLQAMEVSGQEILTKDKVSLRINLAASFQVRDAVKAQSELADFSDYLYRELQFALRQAVGTRSLDELLTDKTQLDRVIGEVVRDKVEPFGIDVRSVGVKDIILPGEMKDILNRVVEAEKAAQANIIKRREETAATRSLLNTARLMADNPTLARLKELETLEKVTEKVDKMTVFGGLDGVMKDVIKINV